MLAYLTIFVGAFIYNNFLAKTEYKYIFMIAPPVFFIIYTLQLCLVEGWVTKLGLSNVTFLFFSGAIVDPI